MKNVEKKKVEITLGSFTKELELALKDYFVGQVANEENGLSVRLVDGKCFHIVVTE